MNGEKEARTSEIILVVPLNKPEIKTITKKQDQKGCG